MLVRWKILVKLRSDPPEVLLEVGGTKPFEEVN
jgi:hypothetical protein